MFWELPFWGTLANCDTQTKPKKQKRLLDGRETGRRGQINGIQDRTQDTGQNMADEIVAEAVDASTEKNLNSSAGPVEIPDEVKETSVDKSNKPSNNINIAINPQHPSYKTKIQYVAKVRYSNNLPPIACPPKLLKDEKNEKEIELNQGELTNLVSSFFRKENFKNLIKLNDDLGMNMNLMNLPDNDIIYGLKYNGLNIPLHPSDQLLLADPNKNIKTKSENVSFLRRTQYISSDINKATNNQSLKMNNIKQDNELNAKNQLKTVVDMFTNQSDISKLKHPTKKHLKAKKIWKFLPDTSMLDEEFIDVKFMSSASISKNKGNKDSIKSIDDPKLLTSLFREIELNKNTKLVSFYLSNEIEANKIKEKINDETENAPIDDKELDELTTDLNKSYTFKKQRDYDGSIKSIESLRQLAITFDEKSGNAYYLPISGKVELKKCRIDPYLIPKIKESTYDQINMFITEPTKSEIENRDSLRSKYDPMEFGVDEEEEDGQSLSDNQE